METYKRPMQRSLLLGSCIFVVLMCALLSAQTYLTFSKWYYDQYDENLSNVIEGVGHHIDIDDLQECVHTRQPSEKYDQLQSFVNEYVDDYDLAYLYIVIPQPDGTMISVCSATSDAEREAGDEDWPLMYEETGGYTPESIKPYLEAWDTTGITYFESDSDWGTCYTACSPLIASDGEKVALLCADIFIDSMRQQIFDYVLRSALLSSGIGILFTAALLLWLRRDVTTPILKLESSARRFAQRSHDRRDPSELLFDDPRINTQNEVESLSKAISQMSVNMRQYVEDILAAELLAQDAQEAAEGMSRLAFEDALTHAGSKLAYAHAVEEVREEIATGHSEFAILMADMNNLKYVNDTFGHENGDRYITGTCELITQTLGETPLYRTGGDEFVAILRGSDYHRCGALLKELQNRFAVAQADESADPWERYSAACGLAKHRRGEAYEEVFARADRIMYRNKARMKMRMAAYVKSR